MAFEFHARAAVVKARLIYRDALMDQRLVDFNARFNLLAAFFFRQHHVTRKQLGLAGRIVLDHESLQVELERQLLQQHAVTVVKQGKIARATFRDQHIAAKTRVARTQARTRRNVGAGRDTLDRLLAAERHLCA